MLLENCESAYADPDPFLTPTRTNIHPIYIARDHLSIEDPILANFHNVSIFDSDLSRQWSLVKSNQLH